MICISSVTEDFGDGIHQPLGKISRCILRMPLCSPQCKMLRKGPFQHHHLPPPIPIHSNPAPFSPFSPSHMAKLLMIAAGNPAKLKTLPRVTSHHPTAITSTPPAPRLPQPTSLPPHPYFPRFIQVVLGAVCDVYGRTRMRPPCACTNCDRGEYAWQ